MKINKQKKSKIWKIIWTKVAKISVRRNEKSKSIFVSKYGTFKNTHQVKPHSIQKARVDEVT